MDITYKSFDHKPDLYRYILEQVEPTWAETGDLTAALANTSAILMLLMPQLNWAGFYLMKGGALVLGPFQGKPAVAHIEVGAGVCGTAVAQRETQLVENVHKCCNHIACDLATNSELVVPIFTGEEIFGVIDLDSPVTDRFDEEDRAGIEALAAALGHLVTEKG